jgi:glycosyltransferase involved in cell wall biosynthesis
MPAPLRVVLLIDDLRIGGAQRVIAQEARALHPERVVFQVVALAEHSGPSFAPDLAARSVPVSYAPGRGLLDPRRIANLAQLLRGWRPDLVHTHLTYANVAGSIAARLARRRVIASLHNVDVNQHKHAAAKRWIEACTLRWAADRIVVVAEGARKLAARNYRLPAGRLVTLPNALDPATVRLPQEYDPSAMRRALGVEPGQPLISVVARLDPSKGHDILFQAAIALRSRHAGARYLLIGAGAAESVLRRQADRLGLSGHVAFLGVRHDVPAILAASDLFVLPSRNEGLSQALLEAMALGTPVVATDVGGTADVVQSGRTGWLIPPGDPTALVCAIDAALSHPLRARAYSEAARRLVSREFNLGLHAARLETLYRTVGGPASQPR